VYQPMLPLVLGRDVSGEVVAAGTSARVFPLGTAVFGALSPVAAHGGAVQVCCFATKLFCSQMWLYKLNLVYP
jgi:NADPH:quinone reductase-like Zn-dependent oxidoreductase